MAELQSALVLKHLYEEKYAQDQEDPNIQTDFITAEQGLDLGLNLQGRADTDTTPSLVITSPYTELQHLLDLNTLDTPNQLMALALRTMQATTPSYATTPYALSFNWPAILTSLRHLCTTHSHTWTTTAFYIVVFNSQLLPSCNYPDLSVLDKLSHAEANANGAESGFLKYWFGSPDAEGRNLATCIWRNREDARRGSTGVAHARAAGAARGSYKWFGIQRLRFVVGDGGVEWRFEEWCD